MPSNLHRLFHPRSIAIVGASADTSKAGYQAVNSMRGFPGRLIPINPKAAEIAGFKAFPSLTAVGEPVDLVVLAIPAQACVAAAREAAACGCGGIFIISGGFGETGAAGAQLQDDIAAICRATGLRMLGPNTSGYINTFGQTAASFAPGVERLREGSVAVVAQSGGVNLTLAFMLHGRGQGVSLAAGLGNAVDVDAADVLELLAEDSNTRVIALHLEGVARGRKLYDVLRRVTPKKPVVVVTPGKADVGTFAQSHTGNLIGSYARKVAALRQAGAVVVDSTDDLVTAVTALAHARLAPGANPGVGLITGQAGPGLLIIDALKHAEVSMPELGEATVAQIAALLPPMTYMKNPVDTGRPSPAFPQVLQAMLQDPAVDLGLMFAIHEPAALDPLAAIRAAQTGKPLLFGTMGIDTDIAPTLAALRHARIPAYTSPDQLAVAARALVDDAKAQARLASSNTLPEEVRWESVSKACAGLPYADEAQAKRLLGALGVAVPRSVVCASHAAAQAAFATLTKPLVMKILSAEVAHKTEVGGVRLGIATHAAMAAALDALDAIPLQGKRAYLVEEMVAPGVAGVELIVGAVRDPSFGPCVVLGLGGTAAEALHDSVVRLAPLTTADAHAMIEGLRSRALLEGWRGAPAADKDALARLLCAVSVLMQARPEIAEIDLNPVRPYAEGLLVLDALML